jgi:hypothetical protein
LGDLDWKLSEVKESAIERVRGGFEVSESMSTLGCRGEKLNAGHQFFAADDLGVVPSAAVSGYMYSKYTSGNSIGINTNDFSAIANLRWNFVDSHSCGSNVGVVELVAMNYLLREKGALASMGDGNGDTRFHVDTRKCGIK